MKKIGAKHMSRTDFKKVLQRCGLRINGCYDFKSKKLLAVDEDGIIYQLSRQVLIDEARGHSDSVKKKRRALKNSVNPIEGFKIRARKIHSNRYIYDDSIFKKGREKITITCREHGDFKQTPESHLSGSGCPKCGYKTLSRKQNPCGFTKTAWIKYCENKEVTPVLYVLRCFSKEETFIKYGITTVGVEKRYWKTNMPYEYDIIQEIKMNPAESFEMEKKIMKSSKAYKYTPRIKFDGKKECIQEAGLKVVLKLLGKAV